MIHGFIVVRKRNGSDGPQYPVKKSLKIGRGTHCDIRIHVQSVSEQHCLVLVEQGKRAHIQNLSSTSQTVVNGVSIGKGPHPLNHGDTICIGERSFQWSYAPETPFFEGQKISLQKRRRSETDSGLGSQNVAVVNPLFHKRRTLGPTVSLFDLKETASKSTDEAPKVKTPKSAAKTTPARMSMGRTPKSAANTPKNKTPAGSSPKVKTPAVITPKDKTPKVKTPAAKTPVSKSPAARTPVVKTPAAETPKSALKSPGNSPLKSPAGKTPGRKASILLTPKSAMKSPTGKTPGRKASILLTPQSAMKSPAGKTPGRKASILVSPKSAVKSPGLKSPAGKTPGRKASILVTPAKSPKVKTPAAKSSVKSARKSKSAAKSVKSTKGLKRKLSTSTPVASKRLKIESPKSIDKKKMAVLMGIHGKSPRVVSSSTLSSVKVVLSAKKTPIIKAIKTPRNSTVKKSVAKSSVKKAPKSSVKQVRRPLFSEILKKKAVQRANTVAKKLTLVPRPAPKAVAKKAENVLSMEIPKHFKFGSTGHANSPETIFISKKLTKTPVATKKGRKENLFIVHQKENQNLSGVGEMFKTPAKGKSPKSPATSSGRKTSRLSVKSTNTSMNTSSSRSSRIFSEETQVLSPRTTPKSVQKSPSSSSSVKKTPIKPSSPIGDGVMSSGRSSNRSTPAKQISLSASVREEKSILKTPRSTSVSVKKEPRMSSSKKTHALLTSTPAVYGKRQSFAESAFESPSSLLVGHISAPQSPASGRKSRMDMVAPKSPYVHSPHASPGKSSLKSSPARSPPSGHGRSLSVSFNDNIRVLLVPGSPRVVSAPGTLRSPASPRSGGNSGSATPDNTTFDFNSIKTPNVPREMFVSSILSSGASSSSQASGSARRKGRPPKSPQHDVTNLQGVRRLLKTPSSPPGYVDVKGVKRLMTAECKTPTYLAVEGVKKLFSDASAAAGNDLSSFAGVRELFASPSPAKRSSLKGSNKATPRNASPVAKIQAEVESKGRSSVSLSKAPRASSSPKSATVSPGKSSATPVLSARRSSLKADDKRAPTSPSRTPQIVSEEKVLPKRGRGRRAQPAVAAVSSPVAAEPAVTSPPKRRTRKAAKVATPVQESPAEVAPKPRGRSKRAAPEASPAVVEPPVKTTRKAARSAKVASPARKEDSSPAKSVSPAKATSRRATARKTVATKSPSPVKVSPVRRTRRGGKAAAAVKSPVKSNKRALSPSKEVESPSKKAKKETPEKSPPKKVATRRARKNASPKAEVSPKPQTATPKRKRKAVTFEDDVTTPQKKGKTSKSKTSVESKAESPEVVSPKNTRTKKAVSKKGQAAKKTSPKSKATAKSASPAVTVSPRKTRSRK